MIDRLVVSLSLTLLLLGNAVLSADEQQAPESQTDSDPVKAWQQHGWPLLQRYCSDCHNQDTQEGELDLSEFQHLGRSAGVATTMQRVLEMVRFGAMPPEDAELPTAKERKQLVQALDQALFAVTCDLRPRPGRVTARRLNRAEYNHTIRDLFGIDLRPADVFPSDEVGAGFDNNADVLSLSPMLIEKYLSAADLVSQQVLIDPETLPRINQQIPGDQLLIQGATKTGRFNGRFLAPEAFAWIDLSVPAGGEYRLRVRGGNARKDQKSTIVAIYDKQGLLLGKQELDYYGGSGSSDSFEQKLQLEKGSHRFFLEPIEDRQNELEVQKTRSDSLASLDQKTVDQAKKRRAQPLKPDHDLDHSEFPFMLRSVSIEGPRSHSKDAYPPSQFEILRRTAKRDRRGWRDVEQAAAACLKPLMRRAFRQGVSDEEVKPYARLVKDATDHGDSYYRGLQIAISAVLVSPRFLFRVETPPDDWKPKADDDVVQLTGHQLATRLSYFLWSSTPDESLLEDADKNRLDQNKIGQHVRRMVADKKSEALATEFAAQWLGLRNLAVHEADTDHFKDFDPGITAAMQRETELLFLHILRENKPVAELLTADYTFLNSALAKHYGIQHQSNDFQKVSLQSTTRRGILAHAGILTLTSNPNRTSPVKRGKWILENVLGTPPPEPPPGVPALEDNQTAGKNASLREQMEMHRTNPTCASCHRVMDDLGFGLEQYDAIGRFREQDAGKPIDASGQLPGGRQFNGAAELSKLLAGSEREAFARTAAERMLTFAIGRELTPGDRCTIDEIMETTRNNDHRVLDLILAVAGSRPFQSYQWTETNGK